MILSKKHKLIFIKGRKVASTSVEILLSHICGKDDIITPVSAIDEKYKLEEKGISAQNYGINTKENDKFLHLIKTSSPEKLAKIKLPKGNYYNHMSLQEILDLNTDIDNSWTIFGIERDPYSKIISYANMQIKYAEYLRDGKTMRSDLNQLKKQLHKTIENNSYLDVKNINLYKDKSNKVLATILHFENIEEELSSLLNKLKISNHPQLKHYKKGISSNTINPLTLISKKHINLINETFLEEFSTFNYKML